MKQYEQFVQDKNKYLFGDVYFLISNIIRYEIAGKVKKYTSVFIHIVFVNCKVLTKYFRNDNETHFENYPSCNKTPQNVSVWGYVFGHDMSLDHQAMILEDDA